MKKTLTVIAALLMLSTMSKAESVMSNFANLINDSTLKKKDLNISSDRTDQRMMERRGGILPAPAPDAKKDAAYYAQSVLSRLQVLAYAQAGYTATFNEGDMQNANTFDMKRAVLMVGAEITKEFYAFFMHEFKSGQIQEYYMEYRPFKALNFRLGQSKIEYTMANPLSPRILESINCSPLSVGWLCGRDPLMNNASGRDMGLMIYGDFLKSKLHYVLEVVNGGQINIADKNNQKNFIAKLEYKPVKNLRFSVSGQKGYGYAVAKSIYNTNVHIGDTYNQDRWAAGFEWMSSVRGTDWYKHRCTIIRCETLGGRDGDCHSFGAYGAATIPVYKQLGVVAQADYFNRNTDMGYKQTDLTAGVQYWIHTKARIQLQYTYSILSDAQKLVEGRTGNYSNLMAQVQFSF